MDDADEWETQIWESVNQTHMGIPGQYHPTPVVHTSGESDDLNGPANLFELGVQPGLPAPNIALVTDLHENNIPNFLRVHEATVVRDGARHHGNTSRWLPLAREQAWQLLHRTITHSISTEQSICAAFFVRRVLVDSSVSSREQVKYILLDAELGTVQLTSCFVPAVYIYYEQHPHGPPHSS
ncbi:uncharacterized protein BJ212DRAFT_1486449 [Suillus subaureus]|uniref:Uncharacterized protein n=1 Tax=Suillus subaureus TaxID=48587 RepID=A0A9P7DXH2_9AGAM|nr:uncharacterized protein BJ212DRAFT_1486449 [Suillus subaureus]KAG1805329.1 hypothetical protein BJ212DRAFT_1486449 [Suillus subaureus]